ncbi:GbsR/MarR family transcriptional regulator [Actinocrinis sp.]|uniref:GbsR/MarR family transcriptional regulator n=1 Tax=Actinocrinis sp. TaxID=1920516 RepID=UPI002DDDAE2B|nr:MarR family transcriptional regulator [Actinocrinis sp.]
MTADGPSAQAEEAATLNTRSVAVRDEQSPEAVRDEEAARRLVERLALVFADWGFPRMAGRVLFALMAADEPGLTATELATGLDASPAAISGAVRYLIQLEMVQREAVPGSRRDRYRLPDDTWYTTVMTKARFYDVIVAAVDDALDGLGGSGTPAGARVTEMRDFFDFVRGEMPGLLDRWQATRRPGGARG